MSTGKNLQHGNPHKNKVHRVLAQSYLAFFLLFLIGVSLDFLFRVKIFADSVMVPIGAGILVVSTLLIFWAQRTSRTLDTSNMSKETFCKGPYCYTRSPTHWGLFFLMLGFGIIANAVFVILFTLISFLVVRFFFLDKEEKILTRKYGAPYLEYKRSVRL
jgi:protein-S-isoprenylcysteine O-methyltransferase Ste14